MQSNEKFEKWKNKNLNLKSLIKICEKKPFDLSALKQNQLKKQKRNNKKHDSFVPFKCNKNKMKL